MGTGLDKKTLLQNGPKMRDAIGAFRHTSSRDQQFTRCSLAFGVHRAHTRSLRLVGCDCDQNKLLCAVVFASGGRAYW